MEQTLIILKPSAISRALAGEILARFEKKGLIITALKMMTLSDDLLREHYAHLASKPFFPSLSESMRKTPVIAAVLKGVDAINVVRLMVGPTNGRAAAPGTIRGDYAMSNQVNIIHASADAADAAAEINRFFSPEEIHDYLPATAPFISGPAE